MNDNASSLGKKAFKDGRALTNPMKILAVCYNLVNYMYLLLLLIISQLYIVFSYKLERKIYNKTNIPRNNYWSR